MRVDLQAELNAAAAMVRQVHLDRLWSLGVPKSFIAERGKLMPAFGVLHGEALKDGLYQPTPGAGSIYVVTPCIEDGELVDLVAFKTAAPRQWLLRTGAACCLGLERGVGWWTWNESVRLCSDPLDWMKAGGEGICVVDWDSPDLRQLDVIRRVRVENPALGQLLHAALSRPPRLPEIEIEGGLAHVA